MALTPNERASIMEKTSNTLHVRYLRLTLKECKLLREALGDVDPMRVDNAKLIKPLLEYLNKKIEENLPIIS
jgi:hypothetical protein